MKQKLVRFVGKTPLQAIFIVPFVLQIVLIVGIIGYISFRNGQQAIDTLVAELQDEISQRIEERLNQYLATPHLLNKIQAQALASGQLPVDDPAQLNPYFWQNLAIFAELNATFFGTVEGVMVGSRRLESGLEVMLASPDTGQILAYYEPDERGMPSRFLSDAPNYDPRERNWYTQAVMLGTAYWSPIYLDFQTGMLVITAGQPVYDRQGGLLGVLGSAFQFEQVNDFLQSLEIGKNGQTFIMDRTGLLVTSSTDAPIARSAEGGLTRLLAGESENEVERETAQFLQTTFGDMSQITDSHNLLMSLGRQTYYVRVTPIRDDFGLDWLVVVMIPASDFTAEIEASRRTTQAAILVSLLGAILIGVVTTSWVTRPLRQLRDAALAFSDGEWEHRVTLVEREDELGLLANTFNQMADELQASFTILQKSQARYESMFNYVPIMLVEADYTVCRQLVARLQAKGVHDWETYFHTNPALLQTCGRGIKILAVNQTAMDTFGLKEDIMQTMLDQLGNNDLSAVVRSNLLAFIAGETQFEAEIRVKNNHGRVQTFFIRLALVPGHEEDWGRVLISVEDITHRIKMDEALRQSEQRLKRAQQMGRIGDWEYDLNLDEVSWSDEVYRLYERPYEQDAPSYEDLLWQYIEEEDQPRLRQQVETAIATGQQSVDNYRVLLPSGRTVHHASRMQAVRDEHGRVTKLTGIVQDITDRVLLEKRVQSQERLAAVGQLAAGIAHDFNNILSSISLYSDLLLRTLPDLTPKNEKRLKTIAHQAGRASQLIQQILDFSRQSPLQRTRMNILPTLQELVDLLQRTLPENITLSFIHDQNSYVAEIDATRFQQIFMNLAVNARDAMPNGGTLTFHLAPLILNQHDEPPVADMKPGEWIQIKVSDTGEGIAADVLPHIFEPFFTTKATGKGTGLGLAQVYGVVLQFAGFITVDSVVGEGTTFTIYLPRLFDTFVPQVTHVDDVIVGGQGETILVVEDDDTAREAIVTALESLDYRLLVARHGREALTIIQHDDMPIDMILSDMLMPEMSGIELVRRLRQIGYTIPVVILSGYLLEDDLETMQELQVTGWLNKPPNLNQLAALIQQGLAKQPQT